MQIQLCCERGVAHTHVAPVEDLDDDGAGRRGDEVRERCTVRRDDGVRARKERQRRACARQARVIESDEHIAERRGGGSERFAQLSPVAQPPGRRDGASHEKGRAPRVGSAHREQRTRVQRASEARHLR